MMTLANLKPIFAAVTDPVDALGLPTGAPHGINNFRALDVLIIIAVILLVTLGLVCWAIFIRKPKNEHGRTRVYKSSHRDHVEELGDGTIRKKKRHKQQRRAHRTRNPTLSEAGGLPPVRPTGTPPEF